MTSDIDVTDAQIAGLLLGVAALMGELRRKGLMDEQEIDGALARVGDDVRNSKLARATPEDRLVAATLAPLEQLRRMNRLLDDKTGDFPGWIGDDG
ncbi:MAG: hypothetical protein ACMVY4_16070 [Minwuia sp.]|uniref:hypothetical protein n=1 Tax=Minwuia sp. TaxID=2493630 RepID=UPI003A88AA43